MKAEAEKTELELKELGKPYWRRKEFFGFQGSILVGLLGVVGTQLVTFYTSRKHMEDELAAQLVANTIESLNTELIDHRLDAGRRLSAFGRDDTFQRLKDAYSRSLAEERKKGVLTSTPVLRVGAVEAAGAEGAPWRNQEAAIAFLRDALGTDTSPLVRYKAAHTMLEISMAHLGHVEVEYWKEAKRLQAAVKDARRGGGNMVFLPAMRVVMGRDGSDSSEQPAHEREVAAFWIDKRPVSYLQWNLVMKGEAPLMEQKAVKQRMETYKAMRLSKANSEIPVTGVSFEQARLYCENTGGRKLPTELQLETAARGQSGWPYSWGSNEALVAPVLKEQKAAWQRAIQGVVPIEMVVKLARVHERDVSALGIEGLTMSVKHWTNTEWTPRHEKGLNGQWLQAPCTNSCVFKGGAGFEAVQFSTAERFLGSRRQGFEKSYYDDNVGFRCVADPTQG